jgi:hypothetical protein
MKAWNYLPEQKGEAEVDTFYANVRQLTPLPAQLKLAWGSAAVQRILPLFSPYIVRRYHLRKAIDYAWNYAQTGTDNSQAREELYQSMRAYFDEADEQGYGFDLIHMCTLLLVEIERPHPIVSACVDAISKAATMFACHQVWRQGVSEANNAIPRDYIHSLELPFLRMASETLGLAVSNPNVPIRTDMFDAARLDMTYVAIPQQMIKRCPHKPPSREIEFLKKLYGY